jgi:hypothetical protein
MRLTYAALLVAMSVIAVTARQIPQATGPNVARDLRGAIDIHVHCDPDKVPRSLDGLEAAKFAKEKGMRGIVVKSHYDPTAGLALLARKATPGIEVFGGIDLNLPVGGMNVHAVEHMAQANGGWGRVVWMSTFDSENQVRTSKANRPFVRVSENGALLPETKAVIAAIAKHNLVMASGHVSAQEALMMFEEGRKLGAILSSDLGQGGNPLPADGFATYIDALRKKGFTDQELDRMAKENPAKLLGLQ